jgi:DNA-binding response OmpR family regulator
MCSVQWRGRCCVLGPSLLLRLIYRLAQHPNRFFTYDMIMEEVWLRRCSDEALRALVCRLRRALANSGMPDLAAAIRVRGRCVGLFLEGTPD